MAHAQRHISDAELLWKKIKGIHVAMLTTTEADGTLRSRPMIAPERKFDGDLWFLTVETAPKVEQVQQHQQVNICFVKPDETLFISMSGTAELLHDQHMVKKLWKPAYQDWLPQGPDDPTIGLLKVHVESAEYWDAPNRKMGGLSFLTKGGGKGPELINEDIKLYMH
jgi:general stress protein 26